MRRPYRMLRTSCSSLHRLRSDIGRVGMPHTRSRVTFGAALSNSPNAPCAACTTFVPGRLILPGDTRLAARGICRILKSSARARLARLRRSVDEFPADRSTHASNAPPHLSRGPLLHVARALQLVASCVLILAEWACRTHAVMSDVRSCLSNSPTALRVLRARRLCCERLVLPGDARLQLWHLAHPSSARARLACLRRSVDEVPGGQIGHALKRAAALLAHTTMQRDIARCITCVRYWPSGHTAHTRSW